MTGAQVHEARKLVKLKRHQLAKLCSVSENTIRAFEATGIMPSPTKSPEHLARRLAALRTALEAAGVEFTNSDGLGVKLRKPEP